MKYICVYTSLVVEQEKNKPARRETLMLSPWIGEDLLGEGNSYLLQFLG